MTSTKATRETTGSGGAKRNPKASAVHFTHDGKLVSATQNKLSSVAWFYTKPLGKGGGRMKVDELRALLAELGVRDPFVAGWSVKLPNGVTLGAVKPGETPTAIEKPKMATPAKDRSRAALADGSVGKAVAKKSTARKSTSKKPATPKRSGAPAAKVAKATRGKGSTAAPSKLAPDKRVRKIAAKA